MDAHPLFQKSKKRVFVSYDQHRDAAAFDAFVRLFSSVCDFVRDNSLERELDTSDADGHVRLLTGEAMTGVPCAVILCGARTHEDKFVDWEIKAALDLGLGVLGVILPDNPADGSGQPTLPPRLQRNFDGGFAAICRWGELAQARLDLTQMIGFAADRPRELIDNALPLSR